MIIKLIYLRRSIMIFQTHNIAMVTLLQCCEINYDIRFVVKSFCFITLIFEYYKNET